MPLPTLLTERLNRRNKAGLFFTLVVTATSLTAGIGWARSVGVALLGLALSWLIGAIKPIHACWAVSLTGLLVALGSVGWQYDDARGIYANGRSRYEVLAETPKYVSHDPNTSQTEYWDEIRQQWLRLDRGSGNIESWEPTKEQPVPPGIAVIPGTMKRNQFVAYLRERYPFYGRIPDDELLEGVLKRRSELRYNVANGEIVPQGDGTGWKLLARPASLRTALHEQRVLAGGGIALGLGGFVSVWLMRRYAIKRQFN